MVPLRLLSPHETTSFTLDVLKSLNLNDAQNRKNRGKLVVELTFDPFKEDQWSMERHSSVQTGEVGDECTCTGGMLLVTIESAQDVEGKKHTNPYVEIVLKGEKKKTKVLLFNLCSVYTDIPDLKVMQGVLSHPRDFKKVHHVYRNKIKFLYSSVPS